MMAWLKNLRLIPEWRDCWRMSSWVAAMLLMFLSMVQADVLPLLQPLVPPEKWPWVSGGLAFAIGVLRLVQQNLPTRNAAQATPPEVKP
jgi:hypothetical protein